MNTITMEILSNMANEEAERNLSRALRYADANQQNGANGLSSALSKMLERFMAPLLQASRIKEPQPELSCCACC